MLSPNSSALVHCPEDGNENILLALLALLSLLEW